MKAPIQFLCIILAICVFIGGCGKKLVTTTLFASKVATTNKHDGDSNDFACGTPCGLGNVLGESCEPGDFLLIPGESNSALAGYDNFYDAGTQPCPCWAWGDCIWRAYAKFDLSSLPSKDVVGAHLTWKSKSKVHYSGVATNETWCPLKIYIANEPWGKYSINSDEFSTSSFGNVGVEVGGIVRDWVNGKTPNNGIFFVGPDEQLKAKSNDKCYTQLYQIKLEVINAVKK